MHQMLGSLNITSEGFEPGLTICASAARPLKWPRSVGIGGNRTTAEMRKITSGIPQIPLHLVGEIASCCAQSLVPACR